MLTRDIDKRPLPKVTLADLSPAMRSTLKLLLAEEPRAKSFDINRIPAAPHEHKLYVLEQNGSEVCGDNVQNCPETVFDETPQGVVTVAEWGGVGMAVVRRPNLQMPDIATYEQLGHASIYTTVYRFTQDRWQAYLCKDSPIADAEDPHPEWVAYQTCY